jgi:hypothetical protein
VRTIRRGTPSLTVANGVEAEVEAIGTLQLELRSGFILYLFDVLYVPSILRNNNVSEINVSNVNHKRKRDNETSSKLWHLHLGHIWKGRMERLIR